MQHPILTVTLNPALDLSTEVATVEAGPKLRCAVPQVDPGGGGINVSRAIKHLGGDSTALVAGAGYTGERLRDLLNAEDIATISLKGPGETRQSLAVTDTETGGQFRFVLPGPDWSERRIQAALAAIVEAATAAGPDGLVVLSGSQPPGVPESFPDHLATGLATTGARLIVDTSGPPLRRLAKGLGQAPFILRADQHEAEGLAGRALPDAADTARFALTLVTKGAAEAVIFARGADGSVLATAEGCWHAAAADVPVVSKVGAGDSFVGAMTLALARGATLPEALQQGAAAASAAVMTPATQLCRGEDVDALLPQCPLTRLQ